VSDLLLLFGISAFCLYFLSAQRVREYALSSAISACKEVDAQLLDQTVSIKRLSFSRDHNGRWKIWRLYHFEYSCDGENRLLGRVIMLGHRQQSIVLSEPESRRFH
jgi:hypothetical protein